MKVSCLPVSFFDEIVDGRMTLGQWARIGADAGLDAIDLSILFVPDHSDDAVRAARQQIQAEGMQVQMVTTYPDFTHPDSAERQGQRETLDEQMRVAAGLGAELVRVTAGQHHPDISREDGIRWAAEGLCWAVDAADDYGVVPVFENHAQPGCWDLPDFSLVAANFLEIVRCTEDCGLGINFDTANTVVDDTDPVPVLEEVVDRVISVHAADTSTTGTLTHVLLGTGLVPFEDLFGVLKRAGWDGWICMEEGSGLGEEGVCQAAQFVRCTWEQV